MIAEIAVETGISPRELLELEEDMLLTLVSVLDAKNKAMAKAAKRKR